MIKDFVFDLKAKRTLNAVSVLFVILSIFFCYLYLNDNLRKANITSHLTYKKEWDFASDNLSALHLLDQNFQYLGEGGQSSTYLGSDKKTVLKLFKFKRLRPSFFMEILPQAVFKAIRERHFQKRKKKIEATFLGYHIAFTKFKDEAGLLFVDLNGTLKSNICIQDKYGTQRIISLNHVPIVLQTKGIVLADYLKALLDLNQKEEAKQLLTQLFQFYLKIYNKGLRDLDYGIIHNIGLIDKEIFHLDPGKIIIDKNMLEITFVKDDLRKIKAKLEDFLKKNYPTFANELSFAMQSFIDNL